MTAGLWFSVVNLSLKHAHGIDRNISNFVSRTESQHFIETLKQHFAIEMSLNKA